MGQRGRPVGSIKNKVLTQREASIKKLAHVLRMSSRRGVKDRHRTVRSVPFNTKHKFYGVPLTVMMCPTVPQDGVHCEAWFDAFFYSQVSGEGDPLDDLTQVAGEDMGAFVGGGNNMAEQAVRLVWALGQAQGARLTYNHNSIYVEHDERRYGIFNGVIQSRFCAGLSCPCDPKLCLEETHEIKVNDPIFCALWVEAHCKTRNEERALIALLTSRPDFNFRKMLYTPPPERVPSASMISRLEKMLYGTKDPVLKLYKKLVPEWMTVGEFSQNFYPLSSRPLTGLSPLSQQRCITNMHDFFHNKNNKGRK